MGFIKNLISGILGLLSGILGFVTGLLPKKKASGGYFLELEEATSGSRPAPQPPASNGKKAVKSAEAPAAKSPEAEPAKITKVAETTKVEASQNGKAAKTEPAKAPAPAATKAPATPTETTFAPKYLAPSANGSNGRRRPGANMNAYLELARQVKTPVNK